MKKILLFVWFCSSLCGNAQNSFTDIQMKEKCDSILQEADWLYRYEKAAWTSVDRALKTSEGKKSFNGYLVYRAGDTIKSIVLNQKGRSIYEASFLEQPDVPCLEKVKDRALSDVEMILLIMRGKIVNEIAANQYKVDRYGGYGLNMILMPFEAGYKLYLIMGTSNSGIIPFGNDYVFIADVDGNILSWRKFHSGLLSMPVTADGQDVREITHSHLKGEPFISATDICTFRLYSERTDLTRFSVYSIALSRYFTYDRKTNTITISESGEK